MSGKGDRANQYTVGGWTALAFVELERSTRFALAGVAGMFFSHGVMIAIRAAYVPVIKAQLGGNDAALAVCLVALGLGSLLAFAFSNTLVDRWGSANATLGSIVAAAFFFALQAFITNAWVMGTMLFFLGAAVGISDIAMNVQASVIEQRAETSLMTRIHACWSIGAIAGSILAGLLIERLLPSVFTISFSVLSVAIAFACVLWFIAEGRRRVDGQPLFKLPALALLPVGLASFLVVLVVGGVRDWVPLYLLENLGSTLSLSVQSFAAFQVTTAIGRFTGDFIRERIGDKPLLIGGGVIGGFAMAAGLTSQNVIGMFTCLAVLGLAHANIIPALISIAGKQDPGHESRNVSAVMGLGFGGSMAGPFLIGALSHNYGLTTGLATVAVASFMVALIAVMAKKVRKT